MYFNFSSVVNNKLKEKNLKAIDLARETGYSPQYICDLLAGHRRWNETTIDKACKALGITIEFVYDGKRHGGVFGCQRS
jgi:transcriptional regulator with XRE-family HTH domain